MSEHMQSRVSDDAAEQIEALVEAGEFDNRSKAIAELLDDALEEWDTPGRNAADGVGEVEGDGTPVAFQDEQTDVDAHPRQTARTESTAPSFFITLYRGLAGIFWLLVPELPAIAVALWLVYGGGAAVIGLPVAYAPFLGLFLVILGYLA